MEFVHPFITLCSTTAAHQKPPPLPEPRSISAQHRHPAAWHRHLQLRANASSTSHIYMGRTLYCSITELAIHLPAPSGEGKRGAALRLCSFLSQKEHAEECEPKAPAEQAVFSPHLVFFISVRTVS